MTSSGKARVTLPTDEQILITREFDARCKLVKAGEEFHVVLLERSKIGVVTAGGRWADASWPRAFLTGRSLASAKSAVV